jgi:hypothetical protein
VKKGSDPNWTAPNVKALTAMLRDLGFAKIAVVHKTGLGKKALASAVHLRSFAALQQGRCVAHAYR